MTVARSGGNCFARPLRACAAALAAAALAACHGGNIAPPGTPVVTLGDTSGDFASYTVTIDSIVLTAADGTQAAVWLTPELVDLAKLTEFSELLGAPAVSSGTYLSATMTVDYSTAAIFINDAGHAKACTAQNASGGAPLAQSITVTFDPANPLVITAGKSNRMAIDFDLAASNSVNTAVSPCLVTVHPFVTVRPAPVDTTVLRSRGLLVITEPASSDFIMNTRPLFDLVSLGFGAVTVKVNAQTYFNVNGASYTGLNGLGAMQLQGTNLPIATYGTLDDLSGITPTFNASAVYAGTSLESPLADHMQGVVAARSGNTITVRGAFLLSRIGIIQFADTATATVGANTIVSEDGVAASGLSAASISVGQQVDISGQGVVSTTGAISLDATAGQVRLQPTRVWGSLTSATAGSLTMATRTFGNFAPNGFNFAGTGSTPADPLAYIVNTGAIDATAITPASLIAVDGVVAPFGAAPPDFTASAVTPGDETEEKLVVEWSGGTTAPFSSASSAGLVVNLSNSALGAIHYIQAGPTKTDLKTLPVSPLITTTGANQSSLVLAIGSATTLTTGISMFNTPTAFATAVSSTLNGTNRLFRLIAVGSYDNATHTFVASKLSLAME